MLSAYSLGRQGRFVMVRRKGSARIEAGIASFVAGTRDLIAPWLAGFGFSQGEREVGRWTATVSFANGKRYVRLSANCDPRDAPSYCNVVLGEGDLKWPEVDWNGVALWRLARDQGDSEASEYPLEAGAAVPDLVERMRADLERYALGFLRGDVSTFHRVRAKTNRTREPYRIHTPNGDGTYRTEVDPDSAELKARFS
jgi:hypothetical protein